MAGLTYADVGATRDSSLPLGYSHVERRRVIGHGSVDFERAGEAVMRWQVQRGAGLQVSSTFDRAVAGASLTVRLGVGPFGLEAPCVVIYTVEEPHRLGFAYGTLPGHPESGEELFLVELCEDGTVTLTIRAFSRPALWWSRAAGPAARAAQLMVTSRYLRALDS